MTRVRAICETRTVSAVTIRPRRTGHGPCPAAAGAVAAGVIPPPGIVGNSNSADDSRVRAQGDRQRPREESATGFEPGQIVFAAGAEFAPEAAHKRGAANRRNRAIASGSPVTSHTQIDPSVRKIGCRSRSQWYV